MTPGAKPPRRAMARALVPANPLVASVRSAAATMRSRVSGLGLIVWNDSSERPFSATRASCDTSMAVEAGTRIGKYVIHEYLGQGDLGITFRARDEHEETLAIKVLCGLSARG